VTAAGQGRAALLVLSDGTVFEGEAVGASPPGPATGELVFNTAMTGYQEVLTDPSYAGQVVAFTYPHIGNYGTSPQDDESPRPRCRGVVVRELARRPSSWRASENLDTFLRRHGVPGITGVDTRRLTRHVRSHGALPCAMGAIEGPGALTQEELAGAAAGELGTTGADLVSCVTTLAPYTVGEGPYRIVAYDFGLKASQLRYLTTWATVEVVPASTDAGETLARRPNGVFLSNGPGDPAALPWVVDTVKALLGEVPIMGICLGHQLLATALGGRTYKLPFGHHGGNHPVRALEGGPVQITSQNHNYAVDLEELDPRRVAVTHVNLNDGVVEGLRSTDPGVPAFSVQYHPEAGPGPHDATGLFEGFRRMVEAGRP
jgi:carbamoyl-phosphate synthase small subunit